MKSLTGFEMGGKDNTEHCKLQSADSNNQKNLGESIDWNWDI